MHATRTLPDGFALGGTLSARGNARVQRILSLLALPWGIGSTAVLVQLAALVRPANWTTGVPPGTPTALYAGLLITPVVALLAHRAVHVAALWWITGARPVVRRHGWRVYVTAPGWYLPRPAFLAVIAAPLVILPLLGLPVVAVTPAGVVVLFGLIISAWSAIGDVYTMGVVVRIRGPLYVGDPDDARPDQGHSWYVRQSRR
ncbi:DUF3267 domain-containing protein [Asanoa sp. WMMD1127]|uniref:DUF3267 domain-containing protein n=1 Tax=Asanoa sp. WMMD1127 TaxID=3016107 RepID=UPI002415BCCD|nr:DUF3267 domain-containing protein [Asanoa sp. WMMD1127]MDG4820803.1 DUF3267 domain-containing protein [Asanoa sp. WMMD1127]